MELVEGGLHMSSELLSGKNPPNGVEEGICEVTPDCVVVLKQSSG